MKSKLRKEYEEHLRQDHLAYIELKEEIWGIKNPIKFKNGEAVKVSKGDHNLIDGIYRGVAGNGRTYAPFEEISFYREYYIEVNGEIKIYKQEDVFSVQQ